MPEIHVYLKVEYRSNMCANNDWLKRSSGYLLTLTPYSGSYDYVFDVYY